MSAPAHVLSVFVAALAAVPAAGADAPAVPAARPIPEPVAAKWRAAGAELGWLRAVPGGGLTFVSGAPLPDDLPSFRFGGRGCGVGKDSIFHKLPDPGVPFGVSFSPCREVRPLARFANLAGLDLGRCDVTDDDLKLVAGLPGLKYLTLAPMQLVPIEVPEKRRCTSAGFKHLRGAKSLRHLAAAFLPVDDTVTEALGGLADLRSLDLGWTEVTDVGVQDLATLPKLAALNLSGTKVTDAGLADIGRIRGLEILDLRDTQVNGRGFKKLIPLEKLHSLTLGGFSEISLVSLAKFPALRSVTFPEASCRLTDEMVAELAAVKTLRSLEIGQRHSNATKGLGELANLETLVVNEARDLTEIGKLKNLRTLTLREASLRDTGLKPLAELAKLESLDLYETQSSDANLRDLAGLKSLRALKLCSRPLSDDAVVALATLPALEELTLVWVALTDAGMKTVAGMTKLRGLHLFYALSPNSLPKSALTEVGRMTELRSLTLAVDESGDVLTEVSRLTKLRTLNLKFTDEARPESLAKLATLKDLETLTLPIVLGMVGKHLRDPHLKSLAEYLGQLKRLKVVSITIPATDPWGYIGAFEATVRPSLPPGCVVVYTELVR